jgi:hypothetical protein
MVVFVCQDNHQPRREQPILRFAPAVTVIEARPQTTNWPFKATKATFDMPLAVAFVALALAFLLCPA